MKGAFQRFIYLVFLFSVLLSSCTSYKQVPYVQDGFSKDHEIDFPVNFHAQQVRIIPLDQLMISVNASREPSVAAAFNLPVQPLVTEGSAEIISAGVGRQSYIVDEAGVIDFPVLGAIKVQGMTREELESYLKEELKAYIREEPVVTVRLMNFRISVLGEVARPGQYTISRERINLLEALSLCGDMTLYGKRDNVTLIREQADGSLKKVRLDVSSAEVINSPYFYLQQNDILYVQPNKARAQSSDIGSQTGIWISLGSMMLTVASLIIVVVK